MTRYQLSRTVAINADEISEEISTEQHLNPHRSLNESLFRVAGRLGLEETCGSKAIEWLGLKPTVSIGRLRRTEIMQLSRSLSRFHQQDTPA